jgi:hypothetical protein
MACKARCPGDPAPECGPEQRETLHSILGKVRKYDYYYRRGVPVCASVRVCVCACVRAYYNRPLIINIIPFWL